MRFRISAMTCLACAFRNSSRYRAYGDMVQSPLFCHASAIKHSSTQLLDVFWNGVTMSTGSVRRPATPMLCAIGFIAISAIGGLAGGLVLARIDVIAAGATSVLQDSYYIAAHTHYVLLVAALHCLQGPELMLWTAPLSARERHGCGCRNWCDLRHTPPS